MVLYLKIHGTPIFTFFDHMTSPRDPVGRYSQVVISENAPRNHDFHEVSNSKFYKKNRRSSLCPCANDLWLLFLRFWRETVRPRLDSYSCRARYRHVTVPERYNQHSQCAMIKNIRQFLINHSKSLKLWDAII